MAVEKQTFSAAVDDVVARSGRKDRRLDIQSYVNQTLRECSVLEYFDNDMIEDNLTADQDNFIWTKPTYFRFMRTVKYPDDIWPEHLPPGRHQQDKIDYFYQGPTFWVFNGTSNGDVIKVAYYDYPRRLLYYDNLDGTLSRPAIFTIGDETDGYIEKFQYLDAGVYVDSLSTQALQDAAEAAVTNWILFKWYDLVMEGALAKLFKNINSPRAVPSFALYKQTQNDFRNAEPIGALRF